MNDILNKLTGSQATHVLQCMADDDPKLARVIETEAKRLLMAIDVDEIADDVFDVLGTIDVEDCWDRAGSHRDGYTSPDEAAAEMIEEELQPFADQAEHYHELGMLDQERDYCAGIILGLYRYALPPTQARCPDTRWTRHGGGRRGRCGRCRLLVGRTD